MTTAEEALARAKAIASRLSGANTYPSGTNGQAAHDSTSAGSTRTKRNRWGVAPSIVANSAAEASLPGLADMRDQAHKRMKKEPETSRKRVWVKSTKERPASHFYSYLSTRLGQIAENVNADAGVSKEKDTTKIVTVALKGRGSTNQPAPLGFPEEPMHILIIGPDELIANSDPMVDSLLTDAERAPPENVIPESEASGSSPTNNDLALTTLSSQFAGYRPVTVAQLIANNPAMNGGGGELIEEDVHVPNGIVGFLIGRGGETISSMQARSGCKVQIQKEHELQPGQTNRIITLQATSQESIDQCRGMIESMVQVSCDLL
jgi:far upstream element-binding protein